MHTDKKNELELVMNSQSLFLLHQVLDMLSSLPLH